MSVAKYDVFRPVFRLSVSIGSWRGFSCTYAAIYKNGIKTIKMAKRRLKRSWCWKFQSIIISFLSFHTGRTKDQCMSGPRSPRCPQASTQYFITYWIPPSVSVDWSTISSSISCRCLSRQYIPWVNAIWDGLLADYMSGPMLRKCFKSPEGWIVWLEFSLCGNCDSKAVLVGLFRSSICSWDL